MASECEEMEPAVSKKRQNKAAWFKSGFQLRGGWGRRPKGNAPDPRPLRWGLAGCCQLDPSHPTIITCAVGRAGRHAPRLNDVGGQPRFPGARTGVTLGGFRVDLDMAFVVWAKCGFCFVRMGFRRQGARAWKPMRLDRSVS